MKKFLLSITVLLTTSIASTQIIVDGVSPQSIVANYTHSWADPANGWGTPDFNIPGTFVEDTLMMVDDGSTGTNAQGNPISAEGCNPLINDLTGKIAVIYRNTCEFSLKALNAQNAGAVGVIIINRNPNEWIYMGAGANGVNVTIPVVMIDLNDGATLVNEMANGPVVIIMGNKTGLYANDIALSSAAALAPKAGMVHSSLAQNGTEFNFEVGAKITNPGNQAQTNVSLNAKVTDPSGNVVYDNTVSNLSLAAEDITGIDIFPGGASTFPQFSLSSYSAGTYTLTYSANIGGTDQYSNDNIVEFTFTINDSLFSYSAIDPATNSMGASNFYRPSTNNQTYSVCTVVQDPNASRVTATGLYFAATKAYNTAPLDGEEMVLYLYQWDDNFTDLNDPNFGFTALTEIAVGYYYYPSDLQGEVVYGAFNTPVGLVDNQRYLACVQTFNPEVYLGYGSQDYTLNTNVYLQPMFPNESDGIFIATGFGTDLPTALGVGLFSCPTPLTQTVNAQSCVSYTSASGQVYTQSGTYEEVIPNVNGCDSIVTTLNLTINASDYMGTSYLVLSPSCTSPADGSITVTLNSSGNVIGDYILISEYYSGSGSSKAVEIYNASNHSWNLDGSTYDPSSGYYIGNWRLRNNAGAIFTFPPNTVIPPYSTLVIKNPFATGLFSNYSSNIIDGSEMTLLSDVDLNDGSGIILFDYVMDIATPVTGQTIIRDQSIVYPNFGTPNPGEWNTLPLSSATLGSHFNAAPAGYSILWADGTVGPTLSGIAPGAYEYSVVHSSSGCVIPEAPIVLDGYIYSSYSATICYGETYSWNNQDYFSPGQYEQTFTNQFGCDSIVTLSLNVNYNDIPSVTANPAFGNAPLNVAFANQTPNLSNYNFTWYFGDGSSQQSNAPFLSHIYTQDGYADVTVVAENLTTGCSSSQTFNDLIFVIGGVTCTHTATISQTGPLSACTGDSLLLSCNTDASFSYQWNRNGVPVSGATSSSFYPTQSGSYTVTIYQNNCPVTSAGISVTINPLPSVPTISSSGTITPCSGGSMTLTAPSGFTSYLWNTGSTASSLVVSQSGNYFVTVTNNYGCSRTSNPFAVNASNMAPPQVCIVGVDSLTNENRVVWEKPLTLGIDSFYVYKESNVSNVYTKIGATDYNDLAVFLDVNSNPAVQAYRYKISALDTCGVETNVGDFHKTIHLTINQGIGGAWNLIWSHYEGLNFGSYNIYRGTDPSNISLLTTIQSNLNSYSDLTPPTGPLYYQIEVVNPVNCDPTKVLNYGVSRSNIVNNGVSGVKEIANTNILVYPNPTNSNITLQVSSELVGKRYSIRDFSGRIIRDGNITSTQEQINLQDVSRGAYYLSIENSSSVTKVIKQ